MPDDPKDDATTDAGDADDTEVITPEVVSGGGDGAPASAASTPALPGPNEQVTLYRMVRVGLAMLIVVGALTLLLGVTTMASPDSVVCAAARANIEAELDEDDPAEAVAGIDEDEVDDLDCADAVPLAERLEEDLIDETYARNLGIAATVLGVLMVAGGVVALVTRTRRGRTIALVAAGLGLVASMAQLGLGFISLIGLVFAVYGIYFSRDARASYGDPRAARPAAGGGLFRPRTPPPAARDE